MTRLDEIRARLAAATPDPWSGCEPERFDADDLAFLLAEIERLTGEAAAERRKVERVGVVLSDAGCECACSHDFQDHDDDCIRCLGCRVEAALSPEVPDGRVLASEGADGLGSAPSTLADLYDDVPSNIADGDR